MELSSADYPQLTVYATVRKDQEIKVGDKVGEVSLKKDIRNFGKKYDSWLTKAMEGQGQKKNMQEKKWRHTPSRVIVSIYLFLLFSTAYTASLQGCADKRTILTNTFKIRRVWANFCETAAGSGCCFHTKASALHVFVSFGAGSKAGAEQSRSCGADEERLWPN